MGYIPAPVFFKNDRGLVCAALFRDSRNTVSLFSFFMQEIPIYLCTPFVQSKISSCFTLGSSPFMGTEITGHR